MTAKHSVLGRGFDALMPGGLNTNILTSDEVRVQKLLITMVEPNPDQPRRTFDEEALKQLAESITQHGVLQPLIVTRVASDKYQIVAGERRWRASRIAGLKELPVIVRTTEELEQLEIALVENIQRVDLSPLETAASVQRLHDIFSVSYEQIAKRLGKAESTVNNIVRLLQLPDEAISALREGKITEGHARSILALKSLPEKQQELLSLIVKNNWSVRQAEQFVVATKAGAKNTQAAANKTIPKNPATVALSNKWQRPVGIRRTAKGGRVEIGFSNDEDLDNLLKLLDKV